MRNFIRSTLVALSKKAPPAPAPTTPPPPPARLNRRQRRQQDLGHRRTQAQVNRALEQALTTPKKEPLTLTDSEGRELVLGIDRGIGRDKTAVVTKDGDQYTVAEYEPTKCHPTTQNDRG
jgi:hypothetical protein